MNIGQASTATGVSQRMIRHYESVGLMPSADRRDNGYRDYPPRSVERWYTRALSPASARPAAFTRKYGLTHADAA